MPAYELKFPTVRGAQNFERKEMPEQKRMGIVREWTRAENIIKVDGEHIVPELYRRVYHAELGIAAPPEGNMVYVKNKKFTVKLDNLEDRDGTVMATVSGRGAGRWAENDQSIGGAHWESDDDFAYAMPGDHPGLVAELEGEGYELDLDDYSPPSMRANARRRTRRAPPGPSSFGNEKTLRDIHARMVWEDWAADQAELEGRKADAAAHQLTAVKYQELLSEKSRAKANPRGPHTKEAMDYRLALLHERDHLQEMLDRDLFQHGSTPPLRNLSESDRSRYRKRIGQIQEELGRRRPNPSDTMMANAAQAKANHPPSHASEVITESIARTLFVTDWADREEEKGRRLGPGNLFDKAPATSAAAKRAAKEIRRWIEETNSMSLDALFVRAIQFDGGTAYVDDDKLLESFGYYITMESLGHGVSWKDDHEDHGVVLPKYIEYHMGHLSGLR